MPAIGVTLTSAPLSVIPSAVVIATREEHGTSSVPVAAIVGGIAAGAFLAVVVTIAVLWWGKSVERVQLKEWREAESNRKTKTNTLHNAALSKPQAHTYQPLSLHQTEKKIKFMAPNEKSEKGNRAPLPSALNVPQGHYFLTRPPQVSKPRRLRSVEGTRHLPKLASPLESPFGEQGSEPLPPRGITHKPSTVSSSSAYSTASGEDHQIRVPSNVILAALGNFGNNVEAFRNSYAAGDRQSSASSRNLFARMALGVRGSTYSNRLSHASSAQSMNSVASRDSSGAPIGLAL